MDLLGNDYPYSTSALTGKHALVCGASKGIGAATAKMLAKAGADVTVCARNEEALNQLCQELKTLGNGNHHALPLDLEDTESIRTAVTDLLQQRGNVHILINNAGGPPGGPLLANSVNDFEAPFKRHLHAAHTLTQIISPWHGARRLWTDCPNYFDFRKRANPEYWPLQYPTGSYGIMGQEFV
jgi:3-oxoacyl-[acyl-carrier protein] reductase